MTVQDSGSYTRLSAVAMMLPLLFLCFWQGAEGRRGRIRHVPDGVWGGEHLGIWVEKGRARVEYDCASGTIDEPLLLDRSGHFDVKGTHHREHGGPVRIDEQRAGRPARYIGSLDGQTLTITVRVTDPQETIGTFQLTHNQEPQIVKCLSVR